MRILLAEPRGFCAGVDRAIAIVLKALEKFGPPIYVRHEIVHNRWVVEHLRNQGAVFVKELHEIPDGAVAIYSAHGVSKHVQAEGARRPLKILDATCPLVDKVHREAERLDREAFQVLLIGHEGHPEVEGTMGQLEANRMKLISGPKEIEQLELAQDQNIAYITQTTLSVDETRGMVEQLKNRFPAIKEPAKEDICYATQNRQNAVKALAKEADLILVLGAPNSSNSNRLREVAEQHGCPAHLIENAGDVDLSWLEGIETLGVTAGASAPEILIEELLERFKERVDKVDLLSVTKEYLAFPLPSELRD
ncbi:4-hydroxy-3-methylbut-2-enyl diphosphate reductase [Magnetococcus sp. PR-3]|uniref:4-hydroxy-3-methylbut-2-enyl diphosphate reductase n=1 Tax=Magnetococcus sp. PR-3 TaxID=3120355 RepID=UPI002FCE6213